VALTGIPSAVEFPLASRLIDFPAGYVTNTFFVPAEKLTKLPELLDENTVVRLRVVPEDV
jgi:hypothetical protein